MVTFTKLLRSSTLCRKAELVFTAEDGTETRELIHEFDGPGILQGMHNTEKSIRSFAKSCFNYALDTKQDLWFATKDTISKKYDHTFKDIFQETYEEEYKERFAEAGITYFYTLIDDAVARVMKAEGGFIWACKNYDGDVMSDMVSSAFGSLAMMTSVLVSPDGNFEYEAAHGTVQRHYYKYLKDEETSTNSVQRSLHGPGHSANAVSWIRFRSLAYLQTNWKKQPLPRLKAER